MGEFIGPLIGNLLYTQFGFINTIYIVSGFIFGFSVIYFLSTIEKSSKQYFVGKGGKLIPANRIRSDDVETAASLLS